jgi:hypothetical protein
MGGTHMNSCNGSIVLAQRKDSTSGMSSRAFVPGLLFRSVPGLTLFACICCLMIHFALQQAMLLRPDHPESWSGR